MAWVNAPIIDSSAYFKKANDMALYTALLEVPTKSDSETNAKSKKRPRNPRANASFLSVISFAYTFPTFWRGRKRDFAEDDITETLDDHSCKKLGEKLEKSWLKEKTAHNVPLLYRAILHAFSLEIFTLGIIVLTVEFFRVLHPVTLFFLIKYFTHNDQVVTRNEIYYWACLLVVSAFLKNIVHQYHMTTGALLGMKLRIACSSLIYNKSLKLSKYAVGEMSTGQLTNLISNDVSRLDLAVLHLHCLWACPVEVAIIVCLLYTFVGLISTIGILLIIMLIPIHVFCGRVAAKYRSNTALQTDKRIRLMNEIITGIQVIKMYAWEKPFTHLVGVIRRTELHAICATARIQAFMISTMFLPKIAICMSVLTYTLTGSIPTASYVFTVTSFYNILREVLTIQFVKGITEVAEAWASLKRLNKFLAYEEIQECDTNYTQRLVSNNKETCSVLLKNISAKCSENSDFILHNINFKAGSRQLVSIIGPVGSGKTSLLHVMLHELLLNGTAEITGRLSYAAQDPWIFAGNVQQNILMGNIMDLQRYDDVIRVCCLESDLIQFPYGDKTIVGERGVTLSGGQRARINLARAIYLHADIYLLDDPLSSVDTSVGKKLFDNCITGFLRNKCTILVTHQLQFLQRADQIYLMDSGKIVVSGSFQTIKQSGLAFASYLSDDKETTTKIDNNFEKIPQVGEKLKTEEAPEQVKEQRSFGGMSGKVYYSYFGSNLVGLACQIIFFIITQTAASGLDYFTLYWVNLEQDGDFGLLKSRNICTYIYGAIAISIIILPPLCSRMFVDFCMNASSALHSSMLLSIINAPMSFFNTNSSGRILNRFSKDMGVVDETIPKTAMLCFQIGLMVLGTMVLVVLVNPWMVVVTGIVMVVFYILRVAYIPTGTSIKRLEGTARSPIFALINTSLSGITTIRAFKAQQILQSEFNDLQDCHTSLFSLHVACVRAFGFYLDLACILYTACVVGTLVHPKSGSYGGTIGLAITQAISTTGILQWAMREWTELDSHMTSVERVLEYIKLDREESKCSDEVLPEWPNKGDIKFISVSLKYSECPDNAINNISFHISPGEKVGIVGRTGAGKSSLIWALFRLTPSEGSIFIDDVDIAKIPLDSLRSNISIIPQQPVLFSGSLRSNLDPFNRYTDEELWSAVEEVELKSVVSELPLGLNYSVNEGGANFSVGQRQLICLARAIICKNRILVLDEATANIDPQSDALIQKTIRKKFAECTVLTIAHRLNTVIESDKIIVMDAGKVVQFGHPYSLLEDRQGPFSSMVQQMGMETYDNFLTLSENAFRSNQNRPN